MWLRLRRGCILGWRLRGVKEVFFLLGVLSPQEEHIAL
jgi:hypothetical protein